MGILDGIRNFFKPSYDEVKSPFEQNPWGPQQQYLKKGFNQSGKALNRALNHIPKDFTANLNGAQDRSLSGIKQLGQGVQRQAGNMMDQGFGAAKTGIQQYGNQTEAIWDRANNNQTNSIINDASKYANNPYLQSQIDYALGDVDRNFRDQVGGINSGATGTGNINSTRAGVLEAQALDNAQRTAGGISSGMRMDAYNTGLGMAQGQNQFQTNAMLAANQATGQGIGMGMDMAQQGYGMGMQGLSDKLNAATAYQTQKQNEIDGRLAKWKYPLDLTGQYMSNVGGSYGSEGFGTQVSKNASGFQQLVGAAGTLIGGWRGGQ